jgi:hypothetical protein
MSGWLRADRIQGSVYPGFNKGQQASCGSGSLPPTPLRPGYGE